MNASWLVCCDVFGLDFVVVDSGFAQRRCLACVCQGHVDSLLLLRLLVLVKVGVCVI